MREITIDEMVDNVVVVVFYKHFSYVTDTNTKSDLMQEGYLKAYDLLSNGNYDPTMSLRNYIYTGVRNAMTNYMYHHKKESHVDLDELDKYENIVGVYDVADYEIDMDVINNIVREYKQHGDFTNVLVNYLISIGLIHHKYMIEPILNPMLVDAAVTELVWNLYDKEAKR